LKPAPAGRQDMEPAFETIRRLSVRWREKYRL